MDSQADVLAFARTLQKVVEQARTALEAAAPATALFPAELASPPELPYAEMLSLLVQDTELADVTLELFRQGHYALAVEQAYKCIDCRVRDRSGVSGTGQGLMFDVFSLDKPRLRLSKLKTTSDKDEQEGFRFIFGGCMQAIRNPRAHNHLFVDEREDAFAMVLWADYLLRRVEAATVV